MSKVKLILFAAVGLFVVYSLFFTGDDSSEEDWVTEEVATPTQGLVTTVKEVETDQFKIEDEATVPTPDDSRIIAKYKSGSIDTFTLDEAKLVEASGDSTSRRRNPIVSAATMGLFGFMMGRSMGVSPSAGAYMDQNTYNRVTSNAGQSINSTAQRTTVKRPSGTSGHGGSRSTRSVGG